jgi:hypothetical protein
MTGTSTLRDYFSTDSLATNWPATTGMVSVANGVASIQCGTTTGNALKTNPIYTVKNDKVDFKIAALPSAFGLPGLSSTVTMTFAVTLSPPQTLAIEIDMVTSQLYCLNGTASALAPRGYDPSWTRVRIREGTAPSGNVPVGTAGNTYFDVSTADDESHWINLGSIRSPTWVATATTLAIVVSCYRNGGTVDVGQVDNVNCRVGRSAHRRHCHPRRRRADGELDRARQHRRRADHRLPHRLRRPRPDSGQRPERHFGGGGRTGQWDQLLDHRGDGDRHRYRRWLRGRHRHPGDGTTGRPDRGAGHARRLLGEDRLERPGR